MSKVGILDASATLAYLQRERGCDVVESALDAGPCSMTAVNLSEVLAKLCERGMPLEDAGASVDDLRVDIVDFDKELAVLAASLRGRTRPIGASLGDRACLALAMRTAQGRNTPVVYSTEQGWGKLKWPFKVLLIR